MLIFILLGSHQPIMNIPWCLFVTLSLFFSLSLSPSLSLFLALSLSFSLLPPTLSVYSSSFSESSFITHSLSFLSLSLSLSLSLFLHPSSILTLFSSLSWILYLLSLTINLYLFSSLSFSLFLPWHLYPSLFLLFLFCFISPLLSLTPSPSPLHSVLLSLTLSPNSYFIYIPTYLHFPLGPLSYYLVSCVISNKYQKINGNVVKGTQ